MGSDFQMFMHFVELFLNSGSLFGAKSQADPFWNS